MSASGFLFIFFTRTLGVAPLTASAPCLSEGPTSTLLTFRASVVTGLTAVAASQSPGVVAVVVAVDFTTVGGVLVLASVIGMLTAAAMSEATVVDAVVAATEALLVFPTSEGVVVSAHARLPFGTFAFGFARFFIGLPEGPTGVSGMLTAAAMSDATVVDAVVAATEALPVFPPSEGGAVTANACLPFGTFTFGGTTCASLSTL